MRKAYKTVSKILVSGLLILELLLVGSCDTWMSNDDFMEQIESEVHDANAAPVSVYVRYANAKMGTTEPQGSTTMKVDVATKISAVTNDDYGFVRWAAFSQTDFPTDKQHSKLTFISEDDYNANYKDKELPDSVVHFSDPTNPATEVKILAERSDVFIIPIVANRPAYVQSVPANADNNVVKNTSIRILFSKPIDRKTIYDEEGNLNISISTSAAVFTDDDKEMESNDITDLFDITENSFSESGKMLTLKLKADSLLDNRQYITVTLLEGLKDLYGFSMNGNYTFKFQTGTSTDSLAPMIEVIYGGTDDICNVFVTFGEDGEMKGTATTESMNAPSDINSEKYTDAVIAQRVYDKLNIFVKANDIINSGNSDINPAKDLSEDNVALVYIQAGLYIDSNGTPITIDDTNSTTYKIGKRSYTYISGAIDSGASIQKQFTDVVPVDKDGNKYNGGTIYTYDVSNLPDGLIRIDVWAGDMTGNAGDPDNNRAWAYYEKHDNGYKSLFIVKDTTPIDSAEVKAKKQVVSNSAAAPYYWYNLNTLNTMELFDSPDNMIHDKGHPKLRALDKNLWWTFKVGNQTTRVEKNDQSWKRIHDEETGTQALHYRLTDANAPSVDGPVDITLYLKDDMGNLSDPVLLDSIMYDNTQPRVSLKSGKGDFVNQAGEEQLHASDPKVIEQILKVTIGESNENNNGSGIRRIDIHIKKGNDEVDAPLDAEHLKVLYAPSSIENPTPSSEGIRQIAIQTAEADGATTNNTKIFNVTDADKITDGTLFIYGLSLGDTDGTYEVSVDLFDSALNKTEAPAVTRIARDTTAPVINKVQVIGAQARKVYGHDEETWWLPYDQFADPNNLTKVTLVISANESGSGLKYIKLADNAEFTESTILSVGGVALTRDVDYTLDTVNRVIELKDWYTPLLINQADTNEHIITLENIKLNNINTPATAAQQGNKILLTLDDFVDKSKSNENLIYYGTTASTGTIIHADSVAPQIATLRVADSAKHTVNNPDDKGYNGDNYTDNQFVVLTLTLGDTEIDNKGSGVNQVILSENAEFTNSTQIYVRNEDGTETLLALHTDYEITSDTVTFAKVFTQTDTLRFTNVKILSDMQGEQTVKADVQDYAGIKSVESKPTNAIIFDNEIPELYEVCWVADDNTVTAGSANGAIINNQTLRIEFTEVTAGVKVIKLDITQDGIENDTPYATPFEAPLQFTYEYAGLETLTRDVDYVVDGQYIILNKTYTSGAFNIKGITLKNAVDEVSYKVKVTLLDASENKDSKSEFIAIDTIAPEFTDYIRIPNLKRTVELTPAGTTATVDGYWLDYAQVNGSNQAANNIPVYIKIHEKSSGVKVITFADNTILTPASTLWLVNGSAEEQVDPSIYTLDTTNNTITINEEADARRLFRKTDDSTFEILVKNVGVNQADTESAASNNSVKVFLSDVAKNQDPNGKSLAETSLYQDSRAPNAPSALTLKDRKVTAETIAASDGYTNESYIDMSFNLDSSEQFGSGYHKFVLAGAKFVTSGQNATTLKLIDSNGAEVPSVIFDISPDKTTLTLKKSGLTDNSYAVVRQAVRVELKNVELDNAGQDGEKAVNVTAYDLTGWYATSANASITLDTQSPAIAKSVFAAAYSKEGSAYNAALNVYPHPAGEDGEAGSGVILDSIPTFYTNTKVDASAATYSAVLGIHATDGISLGGNVRPSTFLYYVADSTLGMTLEQIIASNAAVKPAADINGNRAQASLWFEFPVGSYSAVIVDEAGNVSSPFRFKVEADDTVPAVTNFAEHVLFEQPNDGAKVYRNAIAASTASGEFTYTSNESIGKLFMSRKYVTKKSSDKYRIILNLGTTYTSDNASAIVKKLDGADVGAALDYSELSAAENRAPIEKYAIVTTYTDWAASASDSSSYVPVTPELTDALWHNYTAGSQPVTDEANKVVSWIDANNNLLIELPNTQSTAPVTVFVRDGCGNINNVLLGYDETSKTSVSYIVDGKLGKLTTNISTGSIDEPGIVQNPYLTVSTATSDVYTWAEKTYKWNNQSGNADTTGSNKGGVGQTRGFIKDFVKKATYYNPTLVSTDPFKIGLVLRVDETNQETVLFGETGNTTDTENYTARAMIYCTTNEGVPTRQTIIDSTSQASGVSGYNTGWVYVKAKQNDGNKIVILLDYPTPDYSTLGWTTKDTNGEPKPYFIWYLFEDRVGNYEIAKVVNSAGSGTQLNQAYSADSSVFDRWLYDNEAPKLTIRGTTTDPGTITAADINTLVATNNGFVPYVKSNSNGTSTVYVHADLSAQQSGGTKNETVGAGTTHLMDGQTTTSVYTPFVDLQVSEITGVRAFAWSNSENDVSFTNSWNDYNDWFNCSTDDSDSNNRARALNWYIGYSSISASSGGLAKDIGGAFGTDSYKQNAYFGNTSSSPYYGKYAGTKVNTIFPKAKIASEKEIWLHVMDWTGNISHYRMGQNLKFENDSTVPAYNSTTGEALEPNQYYMKKTAEIPLVRFAGTGADAVAENDIKLYLPKTYFTETGSGVKGYSFKGDGTGIAASDEKGLYLSVPYTKYSASTTQSSMTYYVYDNVGNRTSRTLNYVFDADAPAIDSVSIKIPSTNSTAKFCDPERGVEENVGGDSDINSYYDYNFKDVNGTSLTTPINKPHNDVEHFEAGELQEVYFNQTGVARFHVNLTAACDDITQIQVNRWKNGAWVTFTGWKRDSAADESWYSIGETSTKTTWTGNSTSVNFIMDSNNLAYEAEGTYYQILATDISGNSSFRYFKLYLDNQAPTFKVQPTVTITKGSINKDASNSNLGRYYSDSSSPMTISFELEDGTGVGSKYTSSKIYYQYRFKYDNSWQSWSSMGNSCTKDMPFTISDKVIEAIEIRDMFGSYTTANVNTTHPKIKYVYGTGATDYMEFDKLQQYTGYEGTPTYSAAGKKWNYSNYYQTWYLDSNYSNSYCNKQEGGIRLNNYELGKVKITFEKPAGIIGFVEANSVSMETPHAYSNKTLSTYFEHDLPLAGVDESGNYKFDDVTKTYYAIDYIGKSTEIKVKYSYSNPNVAQNIEFVDVKNIPAGLKTKLSSAQITLTNTYTSSYTKDNKVYTNTYYRDGYIVVKCSFPKEATSAYPSRPKSIQLYNGSGNTASSIGEFNTSDNTLKYYTLGSTDTNGETDEDKIRYYCYLVFQLGENQANKTIYAVITGEDGSGTAKKLITNSQVTWKRDNTGPVIENPPSNEGGPYWETDTENSASGEITVKKLLNYTMMPSATTTTTTNSQGQEIYTISNFDEKVTIATAKDSEIGPGGTTNLYENGNVIYYRYRKNSSNIWIKDTDSDLAYYKFVATEAESGSSTDAKFNATASRTDSGWLPIKYVAHDSLGGHYEFKLPNDITTPHVHLALFLMDGVGNISEPYYLGNNTNKQYQWWLLKNKAPGTVTIKNSSNETPAFTSNGPYELNVSLDTGVQIEKITAENATVKKVEFNGYDGTRWSGTAQPTYKKDGENAGYFQNKELWVNVAGLKVTLDVTQDWTAKTVNLKINDAAPVKVFDIEARELRPIDITIGSKDYTGATSYDIPLTLNSETGAKPSNILSASATINGEAMDSSNVVLASDKSKVTITVPEKDWIEQKIVLKINDNSEITKEVLTIPAIEAGDIELSGDTTYDPDNKRGSTPAVNTVKTDYAVKITVPGNRTIKNVTATGTDNFEWIAESSTAKITVYPDWQEKSVSLTINWEKGGHSGSYTKDVFTVGALVKDEIHFDNKQDTNDSNKRNITFNVPADREISELKLVDSEGNDILETIATQDLTDNQNKSGTVTFTPQLVAKNVSIKLNNNPNFIFEIGATPVRALKNTDLNISCSPATWSSETSEYTVTIGIKETDAPLTLITSVIASGIDGVTCTTWDSNTGTVKLSNITPAWEDKEIDIQVNSLSSQKVLDVPHKKLSSDNIKLTPVKWQSGTSEYEIAVELKDGETALDAKYLDGMTFSASSEDSAISFDKDTSKITITSVNVTQTWSEQTVTVSISGDYIDGTVTLPAITVPPLVLSDNDVTIEPKDWTDEITPYEFTINLPQGASMANVYGVELDSSCASLASLSWTTGENKFTIGMPEGKTSWEEVKTWADQAIKVVIKNTATTTLTAIPVLTIPCKALTANDIESIGDAGTSNGVTTVAITLKNGASHLALKNAGVSAKCGDTTITANLSETENVVTLSNIPAATWSAQEVTLIVGNNLASKKVMDIPAKSFDGTGFNLTIKEEWKDDWSQISIEFTSSELDVTKIESKDTSKFTYASDYNGGKSGNGRILKVANATVSKADLIITVTTANGSADIALFPTDPGAANTTNRSIFGVRTKGNSYSFASAKSTSEAPKTRSVSLSSWVNDTFGNDSEVVKDEVKTSAKKAAKKAAKKTSKKSAKAAKVEKVAAESVAETTAAPVDEVVETVAATVSAVTEVVEEAAPAVQEVTATVEPEAAAPLSADPAVPETSVETPSASTAAIVLAIAALCAAAAALIILALKKRTAKK